jgi:hypothetical protein
VIGDPFPRKRAKRVSTQKDAPVTSVIQTRIKQKPRGRSFEPGNGFGAEHRWVKGGPSPNPSGRPACKEISKALRERLASPKPIRPKTGAERIAKVWFDQSLDGNIAAIVSLADRCEGRPATTVTFGDREDPLQPMMEAVVGMYKLEQARAPQLEAANGEEGSNEDED